MFASLCVWGVGVVENVASVKVMCVFWGVAVGGGGGGGLSVEIVTLVLCVCVCVAGGGGGGREDDENHCKTCISQPLSVQKLGVVPVVSSCDDFAIQNSRSAKSRRGRQQTEREERQFLRFSHLTEPKSLTRIGPTGERG